MICCLYQRLGELAVDSLGARIALGGHPGINGREVYWALAAP